jgi:hypothetical protein
MIERVAANSVPIAIRIPLFAAHRMQSSRRGCPPVGGMKTFPMAAPRDNPHSAKTSRAFVQSGLQ